MYIGFLFSGCFFCHSETTNAALKLFVVSQSPIEGGRFIDTKELPKIGYIAEKPDLNLTNLADVWRSKGTVILTNWADLGRSAGINNSNLMDIEIKLHPDDGKRLKALTERSIHQRMLIMVGDHPFSAPTVVSPLENGFVMESTNKEELDNAQLVLEKLVGPAPRSTSASREDTRITSIVPVHFPNGSEAMILNCETEIPIGDMPNLRKEADKIWSTFRKKVEEAGMTNGVIRITHPEGSGIITHSKGYGFVFEKRADGQWHCLQDEKK